MTKQQIIVSVPLRGYGFEIHLDAKRGYFVIDGVFPSPCGDMV